MEFYFSLEGLPKGAWPVSTMFYCLVEFSEIFLVNFWLAQGNLELVNWSYILQLLPCDICWEVLGLFSLGFTQASWVCKIETLFRISSKQNKGVYLQGPHSNTTLKLPVFLLLVILFTGTKTIWQILLLWRVCNWISKEDAWSWQWGQNHPNQIAENGRQGTWIAARNKNGCWAA